MSDVQLPATEPSVAGTPAAGSELVAQLAALWWLPLVRGVMMIAIGAYALLMPGVTLVAYATVLGLFVLIDGALSVLAGLSSWVKSRVWAIIRGAIGIAAGLFVVAYPALIGAIAVTTLVILLAINSIVVGVLEIVTAVRERNEIDGEWWLVLGGVLSIAFGAILLSAPLLAAALLIQVLGVFAIIAGVALVVAAFRLRRLRAR
ncbi:MAG: DUF308 domain-containing protein [Planctomycetota bacterium]